MAQFLEPDLLEKFFKIENFERFFDIRALLDLIETLTAETGFDSVVGVVNERVFRADLPSPERVTPPLVFDDARFDEDPSDFEFKIWNRVVQYYRPQFARAVAKAIQTLPHDRESGPSAGSMEFRHNPGYTWVSLGEREFSLKSRPAQIVQILHEQHQHGVEWVGKAWLLEEIGSRETRLYRFFRNNKEAYRTLISNDGKGNCRLNI